jgi:co-chaperonin GroES (HSP10)
MLKPRNTVVVLDLIEQKEKSIGGIVLPEAGELYGHARVIAVGPGGGDVAGGHTETFDLKEGQIVFLQTKAIARNPISGQPEGKIAGVRYVFGDKAYYLFEQTSILGIVAEPGTYPADAPIGPLN